MDLVRIHARPVIDDLDSRITDTTGSACQTADARYVVNRTEDELHIAGVGMDPCGGRRAALVGTWKKG